MLFRSIHVVRMDREALGGAAPAIATLTATEGLSAHGEAVARRVTP